MSGNHKFVYIWWFICVVVVVVIIVWTTELNDNYMWKYVYLFLIHLILLTVFFFRPFLARLFVTKFAHIVVVSVSLCVCVYVPWRYHVWSLISFRFSSCDFFVISGLKAIYSHLQRNQWQRWKSEMKHTKAKRKLFYFSSLVRCIDRNRRTTNISYGQNKDEGEKRRNIDFYVN